MSTPSISQLSIDLNSETLNTNLSNTFSSSIQVPSIKACDSTTSNLSHNSQFSNDTADVTTPTSSYTKASKIDLTIKLNHNPEGNPHNNQHHEHNDDNIKQSVTPLTPNTKQSFMFNHGDENDENAPKNYKVTIHEKTPTPTMKKSTPGTKEEFPTTQPVMDSIDETQSNANDEALKPREESEEELEAEILGKFGYFKTKTITKTLQGNIFIANKASDNEHEYEYEHGHELQVVIKKTSKLLHNEHVTVQNGKKFGIYENILKECIILKYLTENRNGLIMTSFTKYDNFFDDDNNYYLSMEHGGSDLFDFIIEAHELINQKKLKIKEWRKFTKYLFWQMIVVLKWLHVDMSTCHLDISLENILIKNGTFIPCGSGTNHGQVTINPNVQIKICDFGLAEIFSPNAFNCTKYCGKTNYKAPEVYNKRVVFDARKADMWSLGVVLFCMLVGSPPYNKPIDTDQAYLYIKNGLIDQLLFQWERNHFITVKVLSLLHRMLCYDAHDRYLVDDVISHQWLSLYLHKYKHQMERKSQLQSQKNKRNKPRLPFYKLPQNTKSSISNISH